MNDVSEATYCGLVFALSLVLFIFAMRTDDVRWMLVYALICSAGFGTVAGIVVGNMVTP